MDDLAAFARLVDALRPWLGQLVVVGGWAHQLHRYHARARVPFHQPLRTKDADIAFSPTAPIVGDVGAALRAAGFREEFFGESTPPVAQYRLAGEEEGFFVEFLVPLRGDGLERRSERHATLAKAGVTAQKLRYLELLLTDPWTVHLNEAVGFPLPRSANVLLANPVSFIAQKLLIQKRRDPDKKSQDALYIHDTLELFGHNLDALRTEWREHVRPSLAARTANAVDRLRREQFNAVTDVLRSAARIPQDRTISPERMRAACAYGLEGIFGSQ